MGNIERRSLEDSSQTETDEPQFINLPSRFEIKREIGRGGMGTVYLAADTELGTEVAVKVLTAQAAQQDLKLRFHQEAKELASLDHPAIVRCIDFGTYNSKDYIVLEYVAGGNLGTWLQSSPSILEVVQCFKKISDGLEHLHQHGIIHRDLKPDNILLTRDGEPRITDLGIARRIERQTKLTQAGTILGTSTYMAPEQILSSKVGPAADIYSLGICLFEALTGTPPFHSEQAARVLHSHLRDDPPLIGDYRDDVPKKLERLVQRMLKKKPEDRPKSAKTVSESLQELASDELASGGPEAPTVVVEPRAEFGPLAELLALLQRKSGSGAHLVGPPGSGRSRFLVQLEERLKQHGVKCFLCRPEGEPGTALRKLWQHLSPSSCFSDVARGGLTECASWIRSRLEEGEHCRVLLVDDLERHDETATEIFSHLCQLTPPQNVSWVVSRTPALRFETADCEVLEMTALNKAEVARLYEERHGSSLSEEEVDWLMARSAGNPRNALFLSTALAEHEGEGVPGDVHQLVEQAIENLDMEPRLVLEVLSICRESAKYDLILQATSLSFRTLDTHLEELTRAGFVEIEDAGGEHFRLCHPAHRKILQEALPARTERRLREQILEYTQDSPSLESIYHLAALERFEEALHVALDISTSQRKDFLLGDSLSTLRVALLELPLKEKEVAGLKSRMAELLLQLGNVEATSTLLEEIPEKPGDFETELRRAGVLLRLAEHERSGTGALSRSLSSLLATPPDTAGTADLTELMVRSTLLLGEVESRNGDPMDAARHYLFAKKLLAGQDNPLLECEFLLDEARFWLRADDPATSEICARRVVNKSGDLQGSFYQIEGLMLLGDSQARARGTAAARKSYGKAEQLARAAGLDRLAGAASRKAARLENVETEPPVPDTAEDKPPEAEMAILQTSSAKESTAEEPPAEEPTVEDPPAENRSEEPSLEEQTVEEPPSPNPDLTVEVSLAQQLAAGESAPAKPPVEAPISKPPAPQVVQAPAEPVDEKSTEAKVSTAPKRKKGRVLLLLSILIPLLLAGSYALNIHLNTLGIAKVTSSPETVNLFVDENTEPISISSGTSLDLPPGRHLLRAEADGYRPQTEFVELVRGQTEEVSIRLEPLPGTLTLSIEPTDATVFVDSREYPATTASTGLKLEPGTYLVRVQRENYHPEQEELIVGPGTKIDKSFALKRTLGDLKVSAVPETAKLWLDGKELDKSANELIANLSPGEHKLKATMDGYLTNEQKVVVKEGEVTSVEVVLEKEPEPEPIPEPQPQPRPQPQPAQTSAPHRPQPIYRPEPVYRPQPQPQPRPDIRDTWE